MHAPLCLCTSTHTPRIHSPRYSSRCGPTSRDSLCLVRSMPCTPTHTLRHAQRCSRACIACWEHGTVCPRYRGSSTSSLLRHVVLHKTSSALHTTSARSTLSMHAEILLHPLQWSPPVHRFPGTSMRMCCTAALHHTECIPTSTPTHTCTERCTRACMAEWLQDTVCPRYQYLVHTHS